MTGVDAGQCGLRLVGSLAKLECVSAGRDREPDQPWLQPHSGLLGPALVSQVDLRAVAP